MFDLTKKVEGVLEKLGISEKCNGYKYLVDGICIALQNKDTTHSGKSTYKELAAKYKTSSMNVERLIRHFISKLWRDNKCGGTFNNRPTNGEFIYCLTEQISAAKN